MSELPKFELIGPSGAPLVVVLGGISASRHVVATEHDPSPGWWETVVGPGRAIDTTRLRVLGVDYLDGGRGSDGRPKRIVSTHDQADAIAAVLDRLSVERAHALIGASYGGMVALAFRRVAAPADQVRRTGSRPALDAILAPSTVTAFCRRRDASH